MSFPCRGCTKTLRTAADRPSSRVNRSRLQSQEAPRRAQLVDDRAAGLGLPLPDLARRTPRGPCRGGRCCRSAASWRSTTIWVAMPAWSVPGSHSAALPRIRSKRVSTSCRVLFSAWPMCSEPVTFGGGMTIETARRAGSSLGAKAPDASHADRGAVRRTWDRRSFRAWDGRGLDATIRGRCPEARHCSRTDLSVVQ